jgi:hypothetical protein
MELSPSPETQLVNIFLAIYELPKTIALFVKVLFVMGYDLNK